MNTKKILAAGALAAFAMLGAATPVRAERTVVLYLIDGLQPATAKLMAQNGATNFKMMFDEGVYAEKAYSPYPKEGHKLENGATPWGNTSPGNVCVHNGLHLFETKNVDDIFLAARERGIKSVYAGGTGNYSQITTPDYHYAADYTDQQVVQYGIDHFTKDKARLIRLHAQRVRDDWSGPGGMTSPTSAYNKAMLVADAQLGRLVKTLKDAGVWDSTYLILAADHGMQPNAISLHDANYYESWLPFIAFRGPGIKRGESIPYAELSDIGVMANYFLGNRPLKGVLDANSPAGYPKEVTGSFLSNIFIGQPKELNHPRYVERYLESINRQPKADYPTYRNGILPFLKQFTPVSIHPDARPAGRGDAADFAIRATGDGRLTVAAPFAFSRVEVLTLDGKRKWSGNAAGMKSLSIPAEAASGASLVRLRKESGSVVKALTVR
jgi:hypothetical protein